MSDTHRPDETREQIARRVLRTAYEGTDSWEDDGLGTALAYLVMAILEGDTLGCDMTDDGFAEVLVTLGRLFDPDDVVWDSIKRPEVRGE